MKQVDRPQSAVQVQPLAQIELGRHLHPTRPAHGGQSHGAQQNGVELLNPLKGGRRQRIAAAQILGRAHREFLVFEVHATQAAFDGAQDFQRFTHDFRTDAVPRQNGNTKAGLRAGAHANS